MSWYVAFYVWLAQPVMDNWSRIEVAYTLAAALGLPLNVYKLAVLLGDLRAAYLATEDRHRRVVAAWWTVAHALKDSLMQAGFVVIGFLAGMAPLIVMDPADPRLQASAIGGLILLGLDLVLLAVTAFTLWARIETGRSDVRPARAES